MSLEELIQRRRSVRRFIPDREVSLDIILEIIRVARRSPSGGNLQPWKVYIVAGGTRKRL